MADVMSRATRSIEARQETAVSAAGTSTRLTRTREGDEGSAEPTAQEAVETYTDLIRQIFRLNGQLISHGDELAQGEKLTSARWQVSARSRRPENCGPSCGVIWRSAARGCGERSSGSSTPAWLSSSITQGIAGEARPADGEGRSGENSPSSASGRVGGNSCGEDVPRRPAARAFVLSRSARCSVRVRANGSNSELRSRCCSVSNIRCGRSRRTCCVRSSTSRRPVPACARHAAVSCACSAATPTNCSTSRR